MTDVPSWNMIDGPVLEAVALACSQGEAPDDRRIAEIVDSTLQPATVRASLGRLIEDRLLSGHPVEAWQATVPLRVVDIRVTSEGLRALSRQ